MISDHKCFQIGVQAALYHGGKSLCQYKVTEERSVNDGFCEFEQNVVFDVKVGDIPRMARICFAVYEVCKLKNIRTKKLRDANNQVRKS